MFLKSDNITACDIFKNAISVIILFITNELNVIPPSNDECKELCVPIINIFLLNILTTQGEVPVKLIRLQ